MQEKACCVTGHRDIPDDKLDDVRRELEREVIQALEDGYRTFLTGFAEGADMLFAQCVNEQREKYPDIFLEAAIPYPGRLEQLDMDGWELLSKCNGLKVVCQRYQYDCFFLRNRYMVQSSSRVIALYDGRAKGGTLYTMNYAHEMERDLRTIKI